MDGPGCLPLQSEPFTGGNVHGSAVSHNKLLIDLNSWTTKARSEWSEAEGLESLSVSVSCSDCCLLNQEMGKLLE